MESEPSVSAHQSNYLPTSPRRTAVRDNALRVWQGLWTIGSLVSLILFAIAIPARFAQLQIATPEVSAAWEALGLSSLTVAVYYSAIEIGIALTYVVVGFLIALHRPREPFAWFTSLVLILAGIALPSTLAALINGNAAWRLPTGLVSTLAIGGSIVFCYRFPSGRFVPQKTRPLSVVLLLGLILLAVAATLFPEINQRSPGLWVVLGFGLYVSAAVAQVYRYRHVSTLIERQQSKWLLIALGTVLLNFVLVGGYFIIPELGVKGMTYEWYTLALYPVFFVLTPLVVLFSIAAAIFQYRLWDIDLVLNRSLVYGTLSLVVIAGYVVAVAALDAVFHTTVNWWVALLATGLVALFLQPIHRRLQRQVNHWLYGAADEPQLVLHRLSASLKSTSLPGDVLPNLIETIARTLKLPYAAVVLTQDGRSRIAAEYIDRGYHTPLNFTAQWLRLPLTHQAETLGELRLAPRAGQGHFSTGEERLLRDIAQQAGLIAQTLRLTQDLQAANEQIIFAHAEERQRIRRELHDGLGPTLAELAMQIETARNLLDAHPAEAARLLDELAAKTRATIDEVRDIVRQLRPAALDELGLVALIREVAAGAERSGLRVRVQAPLSLPSLPAAAEVAAYRIVQEAVTNALRHARAQSCAVSVDLNTHGLQLEIDDDGQGLKPVESDGMGLLSIRERVEEIGGQLRIASGAGLGTKLSVQLPLRRRSDGYLS